MLQLVYIVSSLDKGLDNLDVIWETCPVLSNKYSFGPLISILKLQKFYAKLCCYKTPFKLFEFAKVFKNS